MGAGRALHQARRGWSPGGAGCRDQAADLRQARGGRVCLGIAAPRGQRDAPERKAASCCGGQPGQRTGWLRACGRSLGGGGHRGPPVVAAPPEPESALSWSHRREQRDPHRGRISPGPASPRVRGSPVALPWACAPEMASTWAGHRGTPRPLPGSPSGLSPSWGQEAGPRMQSFPACVTGTQAWPPPPAPRTPSPPPSCAQGAAAGPDGEGRAPRSLRDSPTISTDHREPRDQPRCQPGLRPAGPYLPPTLLCVPPTVADDAVSGCVWATETSAQPGPSLPGPEGSPMAAPPRTPCGSPAPPPGPQAPSSPRTPLCRCGQVGPWFPSGSTDPARPELKRQHRT